MPVGGIVVSVVAYLLGRRGQEALLARMDALDRMLAYIVRRLLLMIPTLFGIMVINFVIIQAAPGGPVEQMIAQLKGTRLASPTRSSAAAVASCGSRRDQASAGGQRYRGARGLDPESSGDRAQFGFDKPAHERFWMMMKNYRHLRFRRELLPRPAGGRLVSRRCRSRSRSACGRR